MSRVRTKVWSKFFITAKKTGTTVNFRIADMPESRREDVKKLYIDCFANEEALFKAAGVAKNPAAVEEIIGPLLNKAKEENTHIVICCVDNDDDQTDTIVGASMMALVAKDDPEVEFQPKTEENQKLFGIFYGLQSIYDETKAFNLDRTYSDRGLFVHPEYRGLGIAQELLRVRRLICKEQGISINGAWMTSYGTQKAAERDGWETAYEIPFEELGKQFHVTFEDAPPLCKFMIARIK